MILYSTGCSRCKTLEMKMNKAGVSYTVIDDLDEIVEAGIQTVPVLYYKGRYLSFSEAMDLMNDLIKEKNEHENQHQTG